MSGAGILLALFRLYYYYAFMCHRPLIFDLRVRGVTFPHPACVRKLLRDPTKPLFCDVEAQKVRKHPCFDVH